jgi:transposase
MPLDEVTLLKQEIAVLRAQIEWLKKQLFGSGKSETLDRAQLLLKLGELEKLAASVEAPKQTITYERPVSREKRPLPAESFAHLPVQERVVIEPALVQAEPEAYERIGEERTFEVDVVPPKLFKREIIRPKYRRKADREQPPVVAPAPKRAVAGGYASAGLLAWIALSKYVDHAPLYRLEQMSARWGATLPRQSMADWIGITAGWLEPIYRRMKAELLAGGYVQADETPVRCNDPDEKRGGTTQGWLWVISRPGAMSSSTGGSPAGMANSPRCSMTTRVCSSPTATRPIRPSRGSGRAWSGSAVGRTLAGSFLKLRPSGRGRRSASSNSSPDSTGSNASGTSKRSGPGAPRCGRSTLPGRCIGCSNSPSPCRPGRCPSPVWARLVGICSATGSR